MSTRRPFARRTVTVLAIAMAAFASQTVGAWAQSTPEGATAAAGAFQALEAGRIPEAVSLFEQALVSAPRNANLRVGAALAAYLEGRFDDARRLLDSALALDANNIGARILLGRMQRRAGDSLGAVQTYERLAADRPHDKNIADVLARWRREDELHSRMDQSVGAHFSVAFEGPSEAALAERVLPSLERAYDRIGEAWSCTR